MGLYSWADNDCSCKHDSIDLFVEGRSFNLTGLTFTLVYIDNLTIYHVFYEFDKEDGTVVLLENNNTKYMGSNMIDLFVIPIQCEDCDVRIDLYPKLYYPNNNNAQSITFPDGNSIPVEYDGVLTYKAVCNHINYKFKICE